MQLPLPMEYAEHLTMIPVKAKNAQRLRCDDSRRKEKGTWQIRSNLIKGKKNAIGSHALQHHSQ